MAQDFDKIFREVLKDLFPTLAQKVLGIPSGEYKALPGDLQYTSERKADQLWEVIPDQGERFILHCELQTTNDKQMLSRMLLLPRIFILPEETTNPPIRHLSNTSSL